MGHIKKENGRKAGKQTHQLADTIMETSYTAAWLLSETAKKDLIKSVWNNITDEELANDDIHELTDKAAFLIGIKTWSEGWYADLDVEPDSVVAYFINWGNN
jgi:hypothetical protein